jgi:hypothetical protein
MRRLNSVWWAGSLVAAGLLLALVPSLPAAEAALAGNWKVTVLANGADISVWLVKIEEKGGKTTGKLLSAGLPQFRNSTLDKVKADAKAVHLNFTLNNTPFELAAYRPKGEEKPKQLLGSVGFAGQREFVRMERTDLDELDPQKAVVQGPAAKDYLTILAMKGDKEREKALTDFVAKHPKEPVAYNASLRLLNLMVKTGAKEADARAEAERIAKLADPYGPEMKLHALALVTRQLSGSKKLTALTADFARQAEKMLPSSAPFNQRLAVLQMLATALDKAGKKAESKEVYGQIATAARQGEQKLAKDASYDQRLNVLKPLATALEKAGQTAQSKEAYGRIAKAAADAEKKLGADAKDAQRVPYLKMRALALRKAGDEKEAKDVAAKADKIETGLDQEFLKNAIPFKPETYEGRKAKSDRVVVLELFTGAQCPPCVAADVAFDALLKTYKPSDVVLLQYHLHIPGPDPLTNKDTEARSQFYGGDVRGTPTLFINGKLGPASGGYKQHSQDRYDNLRKALDKQLEEKSQGKLKLTANRQGDKIEITANYNDLKTTGDDVRLRLVLVEDVVRFAGRNGQRLHHHVVRTMPGGTEGFAVKDKSGKQTAVADLKDLTEALDDYLSGQQFSENDRPLDLKHLKVVALIQDNKTKEIVQAAQVDIPEPK